MAAADGGRSHAVGQTRVISERGGRVFAFRIAGVLPEGFVFPLEMEGGQPDLLTPIVSASGVSSRREFHLVVRVASTVDLASVRARLDRATADLAKSKAPADPRASHAEAQVQSPFDRVGLEPLSEWTAVRHRTSSRFLFWTALGLLAVACLNAAGLAAARNVERQGQLLVCRALGASIGDLARLQLVEIGTLAGVAAALAFALARVVLVQVLAVLPESMVFGAPPTIAGRAALATFFSRDAACWRFRSGRCSVASRFGL